MVQGKAMPRWMQEWWVYFGAVFLVTFAIFWPSFFAGMVGREMPIIIHGFSATGWMLLAVVQAIMIRTKRRKLHRIIGYGSLLLAGLMVTSGLQMVRQMIHREGTDAIGEPLLSLRFFISDISSLILFVLFLVLAVLAARRKDIALHLRLMGCTALLPLIPALERLFLAATPTLTPDWTTSLFASEVTMFGVAAAIVLSEWRFSRLRWPFLAMLAYYAVLVVVTEPLVQTQWLKELVLAFGGR